MGIRTDIVLRIDAFLARTGMSDRKFGSRVWNNTKALWLLRSGHNFTLEVIERAEKFMAEYEQAEQRPIRDAA